MKLFIHLILSFFFVLLSQATYAQVVSSNHLAVGVRLDDVAKYSSREYPLLSQRLTEVRRVLNDRMSVELGAAEIFHVFFSQRPRKISHDRMELALTVFYRHSNDEYLFTNVFLDLAKSRIFFTTADTISLNDTFFRFEVGLIERKLIVSDSQSGLKMVFPAGVGGFDEGVMIADQISLVTPRFQNAWLDKREAYAARQKPSYFSGKPFLRITTDQELNRGYTAIGFHVQPNLASFVRGFDSNGCIRLQTEDLVALHKVLAHGRHLHLPLQVLYRVADSADHPMPKINSPFKTLLNTGTKANPKFDIDPENNLVLMGRELKRSAPVSLLKDHKHDQYHQIFDYDSRERTTAQISLPSNMIVRNDPIQTHLNPRPIVITPPVTQPRQPINDGLPRTIRDVHPYCIAQFPFDRDGWNFTRNRLRRQYNECMVAWSQHVQRRP